MAPLHDTGSGIVFTGSIDDARDLFEASLIAAGCAGFSRDDDDECYVEDDRATCFNCRARRWVPDGFSCMKDLLRS